MNAEGARGRLQVPDNRTPVVFLSFARAPSVTTPQEVGTPEKTTILARYKKTHCRLRALPR